MDKHRGGSRTWRGFLVCGLVIHDQFRQFGMVEDHSGDSSLAVIPGLGNKVK